MAQKFTKKYIAQVRSNRAMFEIIFPSEGVFFAIAGASCFNKVPKDLRILITNNTQGWNWITLFSKKEGKENVRGVHQGLLQQQQYKLYSLFHRLPAEKKSPRSWTTRERRKSNVQVKYLPGPLMVQWTTECSTRKTSQEENVVSGLTVELRKARN